MPEVLTREEEIEYCKKIKEGDEKARHEFIEKNIHLALGIVGKSKFSNMEIEDRVSYAYEGLIKATDVFDAEKGKFSTLAVKYIRNEMIKGYYIQTRNKSGVPGYIQEEISNIEKLQRKFKADGLVATPADLASITNIPEDKIKEMLRIRNTFLNQQSYEQIKENEGSVSDKIVDNAPDADAIQETESGYVVDGVYVEPDEVPSYEEKFVSGVLSDGSPNIIKRTEKENLRKEIDKVLSTLTEREAEIVKLRNGFIDEKEYTLKEVGAMMNLSRERVRQIEAKALRKLRHPRRSKNVVDFFYDDMHSGEEEFPIKHSKRPVTAEELYDSMTPIDNSVNITAATEILRQNSSENEDTFEAMFEKIDDLDNTKTEDNPVEINESIESFEENENNKSQLDTSEISPAETETYETVEDEISAIRKEYSQYVEKQYKLEQKLRTYKELIEHILRAKELTETTLARAEKLLHGENAKFIKEDLGMQSILEEIRNNALKDLEAQNKEENSAKSKYKETEEQIIENEEKKKEISRKVEKYIDSL